MPPTLSDLAIEAKRPLTEAQVRELILAKMRAADVYARLVLTPTSTMTDDEKVDHYFQIERATNALNDAVKALGA